MPAWCECVSRNTRAVEGIVSTKTHKPSRIVQLLIVQVTACELASSPDEAVAAAEKIGFPVVMTLGLPEATLAFCTQCRVCAHETLQRKLNSTTITHKTDVPA